MLEPGDIEAIKEAVKLAMRTEARRQRRREKTRERVRKYRERLLGESCNAVQNKCNAVPQENVTLSKINVTLSQGKNGYSAGSSPSLPLFPLSDSPPLSPTTSSSPKGKDKTRPRDLAEVVRVCQKCNLPESDAIALWEHWKGNNFTNGGKRMGNWEYVISNWERRGIFFPSKQSPKR